MEENIAWEIEKGLTLKMALGQNLTAGPAWPSFSSLVCGPVSHRLDQRSPAKPASLTRVNSPSEFVWNSYYDGSSSPSINPNRNVYESD
jgi:hypothetical protein